MMYAGTKILAMVSPKAMRRAMEPIMANLPLARWQKLQFILILACSSRNGPMPVADSKASTGRTNTT